MTDLTRILRVDQAFYEVDDETKTYWFSGRNLDWKKLSQEENRSNKKRLDGYTRVFRDGRTRVFKFRES